MVPALQKTDVEWLTVLLEHLGKRSAWQTLPMAANIAGIYQYGIYWSTEAAFWARAISDDGIDDIHQLNVEEIEFLTQCLRDGLNRAEFEREVQKWRSNR